jgi:protein-tyrosine phosphatase
VITDYHSHIVPGIDDGSESVDMSIRMIKMMKRQGVERVVATPHFYAHRERDGIAGYLKKRNDAYYSLMAADPAIDNIPLGAEVAIEKGISELDGIEQLAITGTNLILLELPYAPYSDWMGEEVYNISCTYNLMPIIAHIHRYSTWYKKSDIEKMLAFDAIFQFNAEAFERFDSRRFVSKVIGKGVPYVFGSDAHNLSERKPNFESIIKREKPGSDLIAKSDIILEQYAIEKQPLF